MMNLIRKSEFAAILTCSQADGGCPFIAGEMRIPITLKIQKHLTIHHNKQKISERSLQIATKFLYFSQIKL
jgi:arsenate reductase